MRSELQATVQTNLSHIGVYDTRYMMGSPHPAEDPIKGGKVVVFQGRAQVCVGYVTQKPITEQASQGGPWADWQPARSRGGFRWVT